MLRTHGCAVGRKNLASSAAATHAKRSDMGKKARFADVARAAQVSTATVSRVATGSARVNPEIVERVKAAAQELGIDLYGRNKSNVIAFLLSNRGMLHAFHSQILVGAESYCATHGWNLLFLTLRYPLNVPWQDLHLPQILQRRDMVGGVIVGGTNSQNLLELLKQKGIPFAVLGNNVVADWRPEEHDVVWFDDVQGAFEMTRYLQSLGHRHIWYVGNTRLPWHQRRYDGYARAMEQAGLTARRSEIYSENNQDIGYLATKTILARGEPLSAIFAADDPAAEGVYKALRDCGLRVPDDLSVAGFNDVEGRLLHPTLTTVRVFVEQVGMHLAELVLKRIEFPNPAPQQFTIPTQLVKRESCQTFSEATQAATGAPSQETALSEAP